MAVPGEAAPSDTAGEQELDQHLSSCAQCRAEIAELRVLRARLRELGGRPAPANLAGRTMSALRLDQFRRRRRVPLRRTALYLRRAVAAGVAAAAIAGAGAYLARSRPGGGSSQTAVSASVAPLVMEYTDFRGAQPFGDRDGMLMVRAHVEEGQRR
jgi:anti-sigma factor RsiW